MGHTFPRSSRRYARSAKGSLALEVLEGAIPSDIGGFVYVVAPTGREVESPERNTSTAFLNGDGTVYRVALGPAPKLDWALTKPPCYWAEVGAETDEFQHHRFRDWGITRLSGDLVLGGRNLLNTAIQSLKFASDDHERLVVTYESGRPFEIDPETLEVVTPIGTNATWRATLLEGSPFEVVSTTSHPVFDPANGGALYMVNFVRDARVYAKRLLRLLSPLEDEGWGHSGLSGAARWLRGKLDRPALTPSWFPGFGTMLRGEAYTQLLCWDGATEPYSVLVEDAEGRPLRLLDSAHQMGATENYLVIVDAAFKFEMDLVFPKFPSWFPESWLLKLRRRLSRAQPQRVAVHFIPRAGLAPGATVRAKTAYIPCACVHYFVDYGDEGGTNLKLHAIDNATTDSSEFLLGSDECAFPGPDGSREMPAHLCGMLPCGVDLDRFAHFEIDVEALQEPVVLTPVRTGTDEVMWTVGLASTPEFATSTLPHEVKDLYCYTHGLIPEAVSAMVWNLYAKGPYDKRRLISLAEVEACARAGGERAAIFRYDPITTKVTDAYRVPEGWLALSPQYVGSGVGYLVAAAFGPETKEIWIFDANDLAAGPVCKLGSAQDLPWGYTLHSTWIADAKARPAQGYRVGVRDDLPDERTWPAIVRNWVEKHAYR